MTSRNYRSVFLCLSTVTLFACSAEPDTARSNPIDEPTNITQSGSQSGQVTGDSPTNSQLTGKFIYKQSAAVSAITSPRWQSYIALQIEAALAPFNQLKLLSQDIVVTYDVCGKPSAFYHYNTQTITLCDEFLEAVFNHHYWHYPQSIQTLNFVLYHELAHALVDVRNIPIIGNEESTADSLAVVFSGQTGRAEGAVFAADFSLGDANTYADEHIGGIDRAGDIACLAIGSNSNLVFSPYFSTRTKVDEFIEEGRNCFAEYEQRRDSIFRLLPEIQGLRNSGNTDPDRIAASDPTPPRNAEGRQVQIDEIVHSSDYWSCWRKDDGTSIAYQFLPDNTGAYYFLTSNSETGKLEFTYRIAATDTVEMFFQLSNGESGGESISNVSLPNTNYFIGYSNVEGDLTCRRSQPKNITYSGSIPADTTRSFNQ